MPIYSDATLMMDDIRAHVQDEGHEVVPNDNPMSQMVGYLCLTCAKSLESPQTVTWHIGVQYFRGDRSYATVNGMLSGALSSSEIRDKLTEYLNRKVEPPPMVRVSRYNRTPVI